MSRTTAPCPLKCAHGLTAFFDPRGEASPHWAASGMTHYDTDLSDPMMAKLAQRWRETEAQVATKDGWHYVACPYCRPERYVWPFPRSA